jgi:uncharacterized protein YbaP (TraB family)
MGRPGRDRLSTALVAAAAALACTGAAADPAAWRIAGKNGGEVSLLGSMHVLRGSDYPLPPLVDDLYARADVLVMEVDLDDVEPKSMQSARSARTLGLDIALLERVEPWLVAITMLDLGMRRSGFEAERGLEQYLVRKAAGNRKEIVGLETIAQQVEIFDGLSPHDQQALLEQTLAELDEGETLMGELADAWRNGQLETLTKDLLGDFDDFPELYESLVTRRNAAWTDEIERMLGDGRRYLVVVGALHLVGSDSVILGLEARGHRAVRLGVN